MSFRDYRISFIIIYNLEGTGRIQKNKVVEKWDEILQIVKTEHDLSDVSFKTWLKPLTVYQVEGNIVTIIVPSEQVGLNYTVKNINYPFRITISEVTGMENCEINFILPEDVPKKEAAAPKVQSQDTRCEEAHLNPNILLILLLWEAIINLPRLRLLL